MSETKKVWKVYTDPHTVIAAWIGHAESLKEAVRTYISQLDTTGSGENYLQAHYLSVESELLGPVRVDLKITVEGGNKGTLITYFHKGSKERILLSLG